MIWTDFMKAVAQLSDPRFRRVLWLGMGLTLALLFAAYAGLLWIINVLVPDAVTIPGVGEVTFVNDLLSFGSLIFMFILSIVLMVPVASAFTSMFLDDVADAVEARHYPHLPRAARTSFGDSVKDTLNFLGVLIIANILAFFVWALLPITGPLIFWVLNGYLLGREYFQLVAMRRLGREGARAARKRHSARIWFAGILMAMPLSIPLVSLLIPILGAATFTHMFHRLERSA